MNISDFVAQLESQGIELWSDADRLCFRAPAGVMTETVKQQLRQHKAALLDYLPQLSREQDLVGDPLARNQPFPLTEAQQAWYMGRHSAYAFGGVPCRSFLDVSFDKRVTTQAITAALQQLVVRHPMLRAVVEEEGYQRVLAEVSAVTVPEDDLRRATAAEVQTLIAQRRDMMLSAPSDYTRWPLFDARVLCLARETRLLLTIELIVVDAASLYLLMEELEVLLFRPAQLLPAPELDFRDYVIARRAVRQGRRYRQDREYWFSRLDTMPDAPVLPRCETIDDAPFVRRQWQVSHAQRERLQQLAATQGITLNLLLLGAFSQVLALYGESRCFTLNLPVFRREARHPDIERVVGDFTDVTLLAVDLRDNTTFAVQLQALGQQLCDAMDHATYSGLDVLRERSHRQGETVLMPVVFTSTLGQGEHRTGQPAGYRIVQGLTQTPQVLIDCQVIAQPDGMLLAWDSREGFFPPQLIAQAFDVFCGFINRLLEEGEQCLQQARPLLLPAVRHAARRQANATAWSCPSARLHDGIVAQAQRQPDAIALVDALGEMRYDQLLRQAQALAACLQRAGHRPGEPVAVLCAKGRGQAIGPLAILLCGGCYVPIDVQQPAPRRDLMLRDACVNWVICDSPLSLPEGIVPMPWRCDDAPEAFSPVSRDPQHPAYLIYTSGSTGVPKGVVMSHRAAWNTLADMNHRFAIGPQDSVLAIANLSFDLSVYDLFGVLAAGGRLIYPEEARRSDPSHWADLMLRHRITLWNSVPAQLLMLCEVDVSLPHLRLAWVSGDWVPCDLAQRLAQRSVIAEIYALGGATEAAIWSVCCPADRCEPHWRTVPYGTPLANQQLHIVDDHLNDRPDWVSGEIAISGAGLADGYWRDTEKSATRFVQRPNGERLYLTGDRGRYWPDGRIEFLGRADDQVKIRGHRVELGEIAAALRQHDAVVDAVVLPSVEGELHGFVALAEGAQPLATSVLDAAHQCAQAAVQRMDAAAFIGLMTAADQVAILAMAARLRADGMFATEDARHSLGEIIAATQVAPAHQRLLRRWLDGLLSAQALARDTEGRYHGLIASDEQQLQQAWQQVEHLEQRAGYGSQTLDYIRACSDDLAGLLRGERDVRALLFPHGELTTAQAAYRDNLVSRSMNAIVIAAITQLASQHEQPLRILEVGAGVAGTASDLVPALADYQPDYCFTDLSTFFLTEAQQRFADYPWMRYGLFDMNQPAGPQGIRSNSLDVILCANVLHNARHAGEVLTRFATLLAPGGILIFIEPFRRHNYPLLVSMEFFPELTGFTDLRATTDQTFFTREQWLELLQQAGATLSSCAPQADNALSASGQGVFIAQFKTHYSSLRDAQLRAFLQQRLPDPMVPPQLYLLDHLPRSVNGKVDRQRLADMMTPMPDARCRPVVQTLPMNETEQAIAAVWREVLGVDVTTPDADFYACGGDSLLLSRMIGRLRERLDEAARLPWGTLLRHLLQTPTVKALALLLRSTPSPEPGDVQQPHGLVPLWGENGDAGHCCVLLHAGSGDLQPYQGLLTVLNTSAYSRGIGVTLPSVAAFLALPPPQALARLAGEYTDRLCHHGERFTLIGYCLGGLLAAEIARQLTERGKPVATLVTISAWQPPRVDDERLVDFVFARALGADLQQLGLPAEPALAAAVDYLLQQTPTHIAADAFDHLPEPHRAVGDALTRWFRQPLSTRLAAIQAASGSQGAYHHNGEASGTFAERYALFRHCMAAVGQHQPDPWTGKTLVLCNRASEPLLPGTRQDVAAYWQRLCVGELRVVDIPGDHFSCLAPAHVDSLAACIAQHTLPGAVS